jgi:hypothetical protein
VRLLSAAVAVLFCGQVVVLLLLLLLAKLERLEGQLDLANACARRAQKVSRTVVACLFFSVLCFCSVPP